jgi:hypothetical protein
MTAGGFGYDNQIFFSQVRIDPSVRFIELILIDWAVSQRHQLL